MRLASRLPLPTLAVAATILLLLAAGLLSVAIWGRNIGMAEDRFKVPAMTDK
jgi:hypothetical protein